MVIKMKKGFIIAFEGIDGAGKKTQINLLNKNLIKEGYETFSISFPSYDTEIGKIIKKILIGEISFNPYILQLLNTANRWEKLSIIKENLEKNKIVLIDRYIFSGIAYGIANGLPKKWVISLEEGLPKPLITILLDIPAEEAIKRILKTKKPDRYESNIEYLSKVRKIFLQLAKNKGWIKIDASKPIDIIEKEILNKILKKLKNK
jgi:dTMP kinase